MNERDSRKLVKETFEKAFDYEQFKLFVKELFKRYDEDGAIFDDENTFSLSGNYVRHAFKDNVSKYERVGQFTDVDGEKIDILIIYLNKHTTLERGRKMLRSFAEDYLKSPRGRDKSAVLVANVAPDEKDWRFSFVKLEIERRRAEDGKVKDFVDFRVPAKRFSFLVGENEYSHTAQKQFSELLKSLSSPKLKQIEEAFSIEKVTKDFYAEYEKLFERVRDEIKHLRESDAALDQHLEEKCIKDDDFAKKLLGQILFLYFLQKKGWFGVKRKEKWGAGQKDFIRRLFIRRGEIYGSLESSETNEPTFFNDILEPLFYEALAVDRRDNDDYYSRFQSRIPFLNGGLFEAKYEWQNYRIQLPDDLFSNNVKTRDDEIGIGILDIFDRYNFTVHEAEPLETEVAIDPEMLGNVFENLLLKEERGRSGTFYTPRLIVNYMCRQSLLNYLATTLLPKDEQQSADADKLTVADLEDFIAFAEENAAYETGTDKKEIKSYKEKQFRPSIKEHAAKIDKALAEVKVCDPAIGSGAFPVGILQEIMRLRKALIATGKVKQRSDYQLKLHTIQNSIYGVDLEQSAVDIARLRLWLSLIVDEKERQNIEVLPNLDYKIVQGNSLLDEFEGERLLPADFVRRHAPKTLVSQDDKKALLEKLRKEYVAEMQKANRDELKLAVLERDINDINNQMKPKAGKGKTNAAQGSLLVEESKSRERLKQLHAKHREIFQAKDRAKKDALRREVDLIILQFIAETLDEHEQAIKTNIKNTEIKLDEEIKNLREKMKKEVETPKIKSLRQTFDALQKRLLHVGKVRHDLKKLWQRETSDDAKDLAVIDRDNFTPFKSKPFFLWETQFLEIFFDDEGRPLENGGFDIVIANPPYIRQEKIKEYKAALERSNYQVYSGTADILVYFYEKGVNILRDGGTLTFITSNKYFRANYGEGLREFLGTNTRIKQIIDFGDAPVFEAAAYASIILLQKKPLGNNQTRVWTFPQKETVENFEDGFQRLGFLLSQRELKASGWQLERPEVLRLFGKLKSRGTPLSEYVDDKFYRGITTGFNEAFVIDRATRNSLIKEDASSVEVLKPYLRGRDVKRWRVESEALWLIYIPWHFPLHNDKNIKGASLKAEKEFTKQFPAVYKHLTKFKAELSSRNVTETGIRYEWYALQRWGSEYWEEFETPKIIMGRFMIKPTYAYDEQNFYHNDALYFISNATKFLAAILNSSTSWWFLRRICTDLQNGYLQALSQYQALIPIPHAEDWQKEIIEILVDYILYLTKNDGDTLFINFFESIINALVYELFLTDELDAADKHFFTPLRAENLVGLSGHKGNEDKVIQTLFTKLSDVNHPIRHNLYFLNNLESVRLIEGK